MEDLKWYGAFHNESHHPHVHLMIYTLEDHKPYLSRQGIMNLRSSLAKDIFQQDLLCIYEQQTQHRDNLRQQSRDLIAQIVSQINAGTYDNPRLEEMLTELADRLSKTGGKKRYGYLKPDVKAIVNRIVEELSSDERIATLYDLWYEQREEVLKIYTQELPKRVPLVDNPEFKTIRNAVIQEAMHILADRTPVEETVEEPIPDTHDEPTTTEVEEVISQPLSDREKRSVMWRLYRQAKERLDRESESYDSEKAVELLIDSAKLGWRDHSYAAACGVSDQVLWQILADKPHIDTVYLCHDSDKDGQAAANRIAERLLAKGIHTEILVPTHKDWNEDLLSPTETEEPICTLTM